MDKASLIPLLILWGVALAPLMYLTFRKPSAGLIAAYCFQMWMLHWLGALVHAFPWSDLPDSEFVALGFQQATYGIIAFAVGALTLGPAIGAKLLGKYPAEGKGLLDTKTPRNYILAGMVAYFILAPTIGQIAGLNAVPAVASQLVVVGCCLRCWLSWQNTGMTGLTRSLIPTLLIPAVILVKQGFLGFGVIAVSTILLFTAQFFRPRWILVFGFAIASYVGLTVYVSYMRDRIEIRNAVWGEHSLSDRIETSLHTVMTLDLFDPKNDDHLAMIDARLNQNVLIGAAVDNLSSTGQFMKGSTFVDAVLAMIPRLLWPSKPISAGSGDMVSNLTGIEFAVGTSIGIGPVLEFYGNFGTVGLLIGFFVFGGLVRALDLASGTYLRAGDWPSFMTSFLVGISCLNVAGSLVEITAGAAASLVVAAIVRKVLRRRDGGSEAALAQPPLESPA